MAGFSLNGYSAQNTVKKIEIYSQRWSQNHPGDNPNALKPDGLISNADVSNALSQMRVEHQDKTKFFQTVSNIYTRPDMFTAWHHSVNDGKTQYQGYFGYNSLDLFAKGVDPNSENFDLTGYGG